ncbi:hypothetical protein LC653_21055 [Nostoc sp. CHAB 5784]|uniref:hypothetical protein n=1 Tax=Nostoc mirabile TaxID=2907820 RepID=UPI001E381E95|nr:hypothetical protein [Nostoc mirabile]MCC5666338.1 hypothetical protein [Nostoc mirabile CHAB5784]
MILQSRLKGNDQRPTIEIIKEYGKLPLVECYAGQLNQVFMNILSNAIDALSNRTIIFTVIAFAPGVPVGAASRKEGYGVKQSQP